MPTARVLKQMPQGDVFELFGNMLLLGILLVDVLPLRVGNFEKILISRLSYPP